MNNTKHNIIITLLIVLLTYLTVLCINYMDLIGQGIKIALIAGTVAVAALDILFCFLQKTQLFRTLFIGLIFAVFFAALFLLLDKSGFWENVSSAEKMQQFIVSQGVYSYLVFLAIQFLQVVAVPIPGAMTVAAGVLVFGMFWGTFLSFVGIVAGSLVAFWIGRKFGYKLVVWVIGEKNLIKTLELIKGRDKVIFAMMFLLPFFPDDMLCFVAGLTPMSFAFFAGMLVVTRIVTTLTLGFSTHFSQQLLTSGNPLYYALFAVFVLCIAAIFILSVKYGDKIQYWYENKLLKKSGSHTDKALMDEERIQSLISSAGTMHQSHSSTKNPHQNHNSAENAPQSHSSTKNSHQNHNSTKNTHQNPKNKT